MKVLIIDDANAMRNMISSFTSKLSWESVTAADGQEALEKLESDGPFDLILVDWDMPNVNGIEFTKEVRMNSDEANTKILMVTSHGSKDDIEEMRKSGLDGYLNKPFDQNKFNMVMGKLGF